VRRALAAVVPGARTAILAGTRHWMFEQAPQQFSDLVLAFLADPSLG
jgi:pimeloyl-ACP methyl ester carboxylesterase